MKELLVKNILESIDGKLVLGNGENSFSNVSRDSREVNANTLFFFLIGEKLDGHKFIKDVTEKGVKNLVISDLKALQNIDKEVLKEGGLNVVLVENTTVGLQQLSKMYLSIVKPKVIGVTGSVGKTTTKDIAYQLLKTKYKTEKTQGNYNNEIGAPLTILNMEEDTEVAILELGAGKKGDIAFLSNLTKPDIAIVTNVGISHSETIGTKKEIAKEKLSISNFFGENNTLVFFPDREFLKEEQYGNFCQIILKKEKGNRGDLIIKNIKCLGELGSEFDLEYLDEVETFRLGIPGEHNVINCSLAMGAALKCGVTLKEGKIALNEIKITEGRLTIKEKNQIKIIDDSYNASPDSMKAAIDVLCSMDANRRVAFLGDMLELGDLSEASHLEIGKYVRTKNVDVIVAIGKEAKNILIGAKKNEKDIDESNVMIIHYKDRHDAIDDLSELVKKGDAVLIKGSRGMKLEEIIESL